MKNKERKTTELEKEAAEDWANRMMKNSFSEEYQERLNKEFLNYVVYGKKPYEGNKKGFEDLKDHIVHEFEMSANEVIKEFGEYLTEEKKKLKDN